MSKGSCCPPPSTDKSAGCCPPQGQQPASSSCCAPPSQPEPTCCPPARADNSCCPAVPNDLPGYRLWPFVCGWLETPVGRIPQVAGRLTGSDLLGRWQMRWGMGRLRYSIAPGLYAIGAPDSASPVVVTANYKMTFDIVRRDLAELDCWLLVLDTKGINVWCAAGKGTFGTSELVRRISASRLAEVVSHRRLILPQLGAPGVAAHKVQQESGFRVIYGPVRAADLPEFLRNGLQATPQMRRVSFSTLERLVLTPVELVNMWRPLLWSLLVLYLLGGIGEQIFSPTAAWQRGTAASLAGLAGLLTGAVLVPVLLPWLPGRAFAFKGAVAGLVVAFAGVLGWAGQLTWLNSLAALLAVPAVASWCAMHFTGSTTFTSPSGVEQEMRKAIPAQAAALLAAAVCWLANAFQGAIS